MSRHRSPRFAMLIVGFAAALAVAAPSDVVAASGSGASFAPSTTVDALHGVRTEDGSRIELHWTSAGVGRMRELSTYDIDPVDEHVVLDVSGSTYVVGSGAPARLTNVEIGRHGADVEPDTRSQINLDLMSYAWPFVAGVRSGTRSLATVRSGGRTYLKGTMKLAANECAAAGTGVRTVLLNAATLVPVRVTDKRGRTIDRDMRFATRGARATDFGPLKVVGKRHTHDDGYVRAAPLAAAKQLAFQVQMPATIPEGFTFDHSGWAKVGAALGPEASFPRGKGLFFAQWRRGLETVDFTMRGARGTLARDWDASDPFGSECESAPSSAVEIGSVTGSYAVGEQGNARMWWRRGGVLYTLSGPFSATQLREIAVSMARLP